MKVREAYKLPDDKEAMLRRAIRLEWWTLGFMATIILVVGSVVGSSQAMKTAWVEDMLSLIPPLSFLIAVRFRKRAPDERFPYGYRRAVIIAFLCAALALTSFGGYLLVESILALVRQEHPTIGMIELFGHQLWLGWLMIAALAYSAIPPVILGRMKLPLARETHEKALHTDAEMNKADWMTAVAGIFGIIGIGLGWWWADALAASVISVDVLKDGLGSLKDSVTTLMDEVPTDVESGEPEDLPQRLRLALEGLEWVKEAQVRLREEGDVCTGEAFVVPRDETNLLDKVEEATRFAESFDWRIYDVVVTPVRSLKK